MAKRGYIAAVLDHDFAKDLRNEASGLSQISIEKYKCEHVTMAYNPTDEVFKKYEHLIGQTLDVTVTDLFEDDDVMAAVIEGIPTENEIPHVTICVARGVPPAASKTMLRNPTRHAHFGMAGKATVRFIQHQGTR